MENGLALDKQKNRVQWGALQLNGLTGDIADFLVNPISCRTTSLIIKIVWCWTSQKKISKANIGSMDETHTLSEYFLFTRPFFPVFLKPDHIFNNAAFSFMFSNKTSRCSFCKPSNWKSHHVYPFVL